MDIQKAFAITDAKISFVSLVDKAANKKQFLITKAKNGQADFSTYGKIVKADKDSHFVTGIVYEPMAEDAHGNYMTEEEIQKAAYWYAKNGNKVDLQHTFEKCEGADVVESWIAKSDCKIGDTEIKKGTWLMTMEITDTDVWDSIEKGEITGFSMGGVGKYSDTDDDITKNSAETHKKGLFKKLGELLGFDVVEKGAVASNFETRSKRQLFDTAFFTLQDVLYPHYNGFVTDENTIRDALQDFNNIVTQILTEDSIIKALEPVEKAGKKISSTNREKLKNAYESLGNLLKDTEETEETDMDAKDIQKMIDDSIKKAMAPQATQPAQVTPAADTAITTDTITKMVEEAVKKAMEPESKPTEVTAENLEQTVTDAVAKAMAPILAQRGITQNLNGEPVTKSQGEPHYMTGMF